MAKALGKLALIVLAAPLTVLVLFVTTGRTAVPTTCPEWTESTNPYKEGHEEILSTIPVITATSTEKGLYEAHIVAADYEFAAYGSPIQEVQTLTWAIDGAKESYPQRITVYTGLNYQDEATIRRTGLHTGRWETVATALFGGGGFGPSFNWVPFKTEPFATVPTCETLGGVGGTEVK